MKTTKMQEEEKLSMALMLISLMICNVGFFLYAAPYG